MNPFPKTLVWFLILGMLAGCNLFSSDNGESFGNNSAQEILFIGSSYFGYNDMPMMFKTLADSTNKKVSIHQAITYGFYLATHASNQETLAKINERNWDYVILQGCGRLMAYPETFTDHPVYPALSSLNTAIKNNCSETKVLFCMPWAFEDGMAWQAGWTDLYPEMQQHIYDHTLVYAASIGVGIAPVGWAWNRILQEEDYPLHYLHMSDWNHPSLRGSYATACVLWTSIFKESVVGNPYQAGLPEADATYFQQVASETVLQDLELWRLQ